MISRCFLRAAAILVVGSLFLVTLSLADQHLQLHRALPGANGKPGYRTLNSASVSSADGTSDNTLDNPVQSSSSHNMTDSGTEWANAAFYSVISSMLVGLSGIFPLLVIPLDAGPSLKKGAGSVMLKLLLSFAVGSLLGDVFLHLLPEAWATVSSSADPHWEHTKIGLLVIVGMLSFLSFERVFGEAEDKEDENDEDEDSEIMSSAGELEDEPDNKLKNGVANGHHLRSRTKENGSANGVSNGHSNGVKSKANGAAKAENKSDAIIKKAAPVEHIKVTGYLNLLANCIDNFTHGLAVAGSYLISPKVGVCTTIAILLHEIPHEVGDFAILLRSGFDRWKAAKAQVLTASGGVIGAVTALLAESAESAGNRTAWILPFTAGGFIYIALVTVTPDLLKETSPKESLKQMVCLLAGIASMLVVTLIFE